MSDQSTSANLSIDALYTQRLELERQIEQVQLEIETRLLSERQRLQELVVTHVDILLAMTPNHDRTSCSDSDPCNGFDPCNGGRNVGHIRCTRCGLLNIKERGVSDVAASVTLVSPIQVMK